MWVESDKVEWKRDLSSDLRKELVAFANTQGGRLYIGIEDDGTVCGVPHANKILETLSSLIRDMIQETDGTPWESMRSFHQDLTFSAAKIVFQRQNLPFEPIQQRSLGLLNAEGLFTNLGLLLSDQCPHTLKAAVFKGSTMDEFTARREFEGSLLTQMEQAYTFIDLNNDTHASFNGLLRTDTRDYPEEALREALMNALIHRDYAFSGSTLVSMYADRLEIVSLGGLAPGLEPEDIFEGVSQTRNVQLAKLFYRLHYVEAYGTGIRKIRSACEAVGVTPVFRMTHAAFRVILPNRHAERKTVLALEEKPLPYTLSENTTAELSEQAGTDWRSALSFIRTKPQVTRRMLQEALGFGQTKSGLILNELERMGYLNRSGAGRNTTYRLR